MTIFTRSAVVGLMVGIATPAFAGGFSTARFGGEHGHAATDDVTSIYYNPAGVALGEGTRIHVEGTVAYRTVDYVRDAGAIDNPGTGTPDDAIGANSGKAKLANVLTSPFAGVITDFGIDGLGVGLGFSAPFGGQAKWDKVDEWEGNTQYPGAVDGPQRWANVEGLQRALYYTLAVGYRTPNRRFVVGAGVNLVQQQISLVRARIVTGTDDLVNPDGTVAEGRSLLELDGLDVSASVGAMVHVNSCFRIGASYQSQPGFGETELEGTLVNKFGAGAANTPESGKVGLRQALPDIVRVGAVWAPRERLQLRASVDWQRWSVYESQCLVSTHDADGNPIPKQNCEFNEDGSSSTENGALLNLPRDWKDTFSGRLGASYWAANSLELNGGVTYDTNAVPDETMDPSLFDMNKVIGTIGLRWSLTRALRLEATFAHVFYFDRTTAPRDEPLVSPSRNPDMAGEFKQAVSYAIAGVNVAL